MPTIDEKTRKQVEREYLARLLESGGATGCGLGKDYIRRLRKRDVFLTIFTLSGILVMLYYIITGRGWC